MNQITPFALTAKNAAKTLDMSEREFLALVEQGALPPPSWYGRWNAEELRRIVNGDAARYGGLEL